MRRTAFEACAIAMPGAMRMPTDAWQKLRREIEDASRSRAIRSPRLRQVSAAYRPTVTNLQF